MTMQTLRAESPAYNLGDGSIARFLLLVHIIFSKKNRAPVLEETLLPELFAYLATVARNDGSECYRVGGVADHVHLAIRLNRTSNVSGLVGELKSASSQWVKGRAPGLSDFSWQRGYGAFSVGPADLNSLIAYIDAQREHHAKRDFQEEFRAFLRKYGVEFDERYVWD
jgi:putative transposase